MALLFVVLPRLMHESLNASQGVCLLLPIIGHVENGKIVVLLAISLEERADNRSRHACKWHHVDDPAGPLLTEVNGFPDTEYRLSLERIVHIGAGFMENLSGRGLMTMAQVMAENLFESMLILFLVILSQGDPQKVGKVLPF